MRSPAPPPTPRSTCSKREPRLAQVAALSAALAEGLEPCRGLPGVRDVRVLGGIGVVELAPARRRRALRGAFLDEGVWVRPFGHIVYLTPAFTIDADDLARLTAAVRRVVERWSADLWGAGMSYDAGQLKLSGCACGRGRRAGRSRRRGARP